MFNRDAKAKIIRNGQFGSYRCSVIVNSSRRFVATSYVQLFRVLISQSMYPVKCWQEWCGALYPGPGVCRGTSQCCSESEHWRGCSTDSPTSDGRQQSSCSLSPSGDPSLSSANLLIHTKNANILHEIFIDEGRRYDGYSFYLEL